jgi:hypothetical protein
VLPHLKEGSSIINTSSVNAYKGNASLIPYTSTKGAEVSSTLAMHCLWVFLSWQGGRTPTGLPVGSGGGALFSAEQSSPGLAVTSTISGSGVSSGFDSNWASGMGSSNSAGYAHLCPLTPGWIGICPFAKLTGIAWWHGLDTCGFSQHC